MKYYIVLIYTLCNEALTHAVVSPVDLHVILWTHTGVVPQCVVAGARAADYRIHHTLVNVCRVTEVISSWY